MAVNDFTLIYVVNENFNAVPGVLYLVSAQSMNVTVQLPAAASVAAGGAVIVKRVDSAGHSVIIVPASGEHVDGLTAGISLSQQGQGRWLWPGAPAGPAAGAGWTSY